ncbi:MAG: glycosyltransferase family 1 protein [Nitrospirota bacterium]|nr:glycosyltransferase family 1 protein [Nitrospirota bacterium]
MLTNYRVGFDARPVLAPYSGIGQYVRQLFPSMFRINPSVEWIAYASLEARSHLSVDGLMNPVTIKPGASRWIPKWMDRSSERLNVFHGTNFKAPNYGQKKTVLTIHDLWLERYPAYSKKLLGQGLSSWKTRRGAAQAEKIIAVSKFSKQEIHEVFAIPCEKIAVIYHGCSCDMFPDCDEGKWQEVRARLGLSDRPFILFVGGAEPRKNHRVLFEAFAQSSRLTQEISLVAIGDETVRGTSLRQTAHTLGLSEVVKCPGSLSTADLRVVYSKAVALVFPSLYEGFGIPLLEAMACGTPIITGQETALPEVAGEAALYVNAQDSEQLGTVIRQLLIDSVLQERLRKKGFERVKQFTWERAARDTLAVYEEVC